MARVIIDWNDERVEALKVLWGDGYSASEIAKRLSLGSRNAIIGKVHRLRLPCHKRPTGEKRAAIKQKLYKPKPPRPMALRVVKPPPPPPPEPWDGPSISMLDDGLRAFMCREIVAGSGVDTMFCGAPTVPGSQFSYCPFHAAKNLRVVKRKDPVPRFVPYRVAA